MICKQLKIELSKFTYEYFYRRVAFLFSKDTLNKYKCKIYENGVTHSFTCHPQKLQTDAKKRRRSDNSEPHRKKKLILSDDESDDDVMDGGNSRQQSSGMSDSDE